MPRLILTACLAALVVTAPLFAQETATAELPAPVLAAPGTTTPNTRRQ